MIIDVRESEEVRVSIEYRNNNNSQIVISNTSNTDETIGAVFFQYVAKQYDNRYWIQKQIQDPLALAILSGPSTGHVPVWCYSGSNAIVAMAR